MAVVTLPAVLGLRSLGGADAALPDVAPPRARRAAAGDGLARDRPRFRLRGRRGGRAGGRSAALPAVSGEVFNLGTGVESTLRDVVAAVQAAVGGGSEVKWGAMPARHWDTDRWQADAAKARTHARAGRRGRRWPRALARMAAWMAATGEPSMDCDRRRPWPRDGPAAAALDRRAVAGRERRATSAPRCPSSTSWPPCGAGTLRSPGTDRRRAATASSSPRATPRSRCTARCASRASSTRPTFRTFCRDGSLLGVHPRARASRAWTCPRGRWARASPSAAGSPTASRRRGSRSRVYVAAERRRVQRGPGLGGGDVRRPSPAGQPGGGGRPERHAGARPAPTTSSPSTCRGCGRPSAGTRSTWTVTTSPRCSRPSIAPASGRPTAIVAPHRAGQGRLLHGGAPRVALPQPHARRSRSRRWPSSGRSREEGLPRGAARAGAGGRPDLPAHRRPRLERRRAVRGEAAGAVPERRAWRRPNMAGLAAGLAQAGFIPFIYSIATFTSMRCYEQVRNGALLHHLPVRVVGIGGGFAYGHAGPTHYALEDLAIARTQPRDDGARARRSRAGARRAPRHRRPRRPRVPAHRQGRQPAGARPRRPLRARPARSRARGRRRALPRLRHHGARGPGGGAAARGRRRSRPRWPCSPTWVRAVAGAGRAARPVRIGGHRRGRLRRRGPRLAGRGGHRRGTGCGRGWPFAAWTAPSAPRPGARPTCGRRPGSTRPRWPRPPARSRLRPRRPVDDGRGAPFRRPPVPQPGGSHRRGPAAATRRPLARAGRPYELVVVPNACTDRTPERVRAVAAADPNIRVVENPRGGWGLSVLTGLAAARGSLLCYTNSARTDPEHVAAVADLAVAHAPCLAKVRARAPGRAAARGRLLALQPRRAACSSASGRGT